jgi:probable HAF family extracellular repeat protein
LLGVALAACTLSACNATASRLLPQRDAGSSAARAAASSPIDYRVVEMPTLGGTFSLGNSINESGTIPGIATLKGDKVSHAVMWDGSRLVDLTSFGGPNASADISNNFGVVGGFAESTATAPLGEDNCQDKTFKVCSPVIWRGGHAVILPLLGGNNGVVAFGLSDTGQAVGYSETATHQSTCPKPQVLQEVPVMWGPSANEVHQLPIYPGDTDGQALEMNQHGTVVGGSGDCTSVYTNGLPAPHQLIWNHGKAALIGAKPGVPIGINDRDQVVGYFILRGTTKHGYLWQNGSMKDLGVLPGDVDSKGFWISDAGQIVGQSCDAKGNCRAVIWNKGAWTDLNTLLPKGTALYLMMAFGINSGGEITGLAFNTKTKQVRGYLAIPDGSPFGPRVSRIVPHLVLPQAARQQIQRFSPRLHQPD